MKPLGWDDLPLSSRYRAIDVAVNALERELRDAPSDAGRDSSTNTNVVVARALRDFLRGVRW